jgi:hypothetical protein
MCALREASMLQGFVIPVNIRVTDANDNAPQFINAPYILNISEVCNTTHITYCNVVRGFINRHAVHSRRHSTFDISRITTSRPKRAFKGAGLITFLNVRR